MVTTIDDLVERSREGVHRPGAREAHDAQQAGALLVDIRPAAQRAAEGEIPGSLIIERNVLEWRLDPAGSHRIPEAVGYDVEIVVVCSEGYASSLAAASLREIGLHRATDLDGGFVGWAAAGLPTRAGGSSPACGGSRARTGG
ncbi:sulfurtransferase [Kitasatospora herbaricolor]|uniref:rhodanese-like domain-containing protein n=1 Tax=Kitasatospora herbaricolor TaxID=68217 RepID=UPI001748F669|nr:rhodanese-like domain-containing protein [Kitasatospora herbaricolor]MDQ0311603.1 rhodanese-related sulfurtransferase [Kitasatospora herbaricolor]GGU95432.1 sulfurtransferase [Kitasatospora herbaricolor]